MAFKISAEARNAELDGIETAVGESPRLRFYTGAPPASTLHAATGTLIATLVLPVDWMLAAAAGQKLKQGVWTGQCVAAGTIGYFRLYNSDLSVCHAQGTVSNTGGTGDMTFDNSVVEVAQSLVINSFTLTAENA